MEMPTRWHYVALAALHIDEIIIAVMARRAARGSASRANRSDAANKNQDKGEGYEVIHCYLPVRFSGKPLPYYSRFAHFFGSSEDSAPYAVHEICNSTNHAHYKSTA
jgi:hypothetical protein